MLRHVTIFRIYLFLLLALCAGCWFANSLPEWLGSLFFMVLMLSLLGIVILCMVRLCIALMRKRLSYEAHCSELAVVLTTLALVLLGSLAFGPIC